MLWFNLACEYSHLSFAHVVAGANERQLYSQARFKFGLIF